MKLEELIFPTTPEAFTAFQKRPMERDTSGWYGDLSLWLERNCDNAWLLGLVGRFARKLERR